MRGADVSGRAGLVTPGRRAVVFVVVTVVISWALWGVLVVTTADPGAGAGSMALWWLGGAGPPLAAAALALREGGYAGLRALLSPLTRWRLGRFGWVLLAPLPFGVAAVALAAGLTPVELSLPGLGVLVQLPLLLAAGVLFGGLEEIGWRGYLQPVLQARWSALTASLAVGLVWGVWHLPLFLLAGTTQADASAGWFVVQAVALSVVFAWALNASGGNLLLLVLLHGAVNGWYSAAVQGLAPQVGPVFSVAAALLAVPAAFALIVGFGPRRLAAAEPVVWPPAHTAAGGRAPGTTGVASKT